MDPPGWMLLVHPHAPNEVLATNKIKLHVRRVLKIEDICDELVPEWLIFW